MAKLITAEDIKNIEETKSFVSKNLKNIEDQAFANVLRDIIFNSDIDWKDIQLIIERHMPEVNLK